jgi:uncharacterized protein YkwD
MSPHPNRAMTQQELAEWNREYDSLGGMNSFELEVLYLINTIRIENNLTPFGLCPALNKASRLYSNLVDELNLTGHHDPFYGAMQTVTPTDAVTERALLFDSTLRDRPRSFVGENSSGRGSVYSVPQGAVNNWMHSNGHRGQILSERWEDPHIGVGSAVNVITKFNAVLAR